jgi:hypothetical protein
MKISDAKVIFNCPARHFVTSKIVTDEGQSHSHNSAKKIGKRKFFDDKIRWRTDSAMDCTRIGDPVGICVPLISGFCRADVALHDSG